MAHSNDKFLDDAKSVATDARELAREATEKSAATAAGALDKLRASLEDMQERLSATQEAAVEKVRAATRATDDYVHDAPWSSIAAAAVVAFAIGFLLGRGRS